MCPRPAETHPVCSTSNTRSGHRSSNAPSTMTITRRTEMFTRRQALMGVAAAAVLAGMPPMSAWANEAEIAALPREKVTLVAPPFVHAHEQVATGGPKIVEF